MMVSAFKEPPALGLGFRDIRFRVSRKLSVSGRPLPGPTTISSRLSEPVPSQLLGSNPVAVSGCLRVKSFGFRV